MRFLLDHNISPRVGIALVEAGHDAIALRDVGLSAATDEAVMAHARADSRIVVSADTDFGTLLARSEADSPSLLLLRRAANRRPMEQAALILANLGSVEADLAAGAIVVLGERTLRIRRLPI